MRHFHFAYLAILCLSAAACSDAAGPHAALVTRIDRASLDSTKVLTAVFTLTNLGRYNQQISACDGEPLPEWQKLESGAWDKAFGGPADCPAPAIFSGVISITPGTALEGTSGFWEGEPGTYRLVWYQVTGAPLVLSDPFTIK